MDSVELADMAIDEVERDIDAVYFVECYWPEEIENDSMEAAFFNLGEFSEALKACGLRYMGLIEQLK